MGSLERITYANLVDRCSTLVVFPSASGIITYSNANTQSTGARNSLIK